MPYRNRNACAGLPVTTNVASAGRSKIHRPPHRGGCRSSIRFRRWLTSKSKRGTNVAMTTDSLRNVSERGLPHELNRVLVQQSDVDARLAAAKAVFQVDLGDDVR